jgi:hypothetical protein
MNRLSRAAGVAALLSLGGACGASSIPPLPGTDAAADAPADAAAADAAGTAGDARADGPPSERPPTAPPNPCAMGVPWFDLPYSVKAAVYTRARGLLVLVPEIDHAIHLLDPETCVDTKVVVPRLPASVALSPSESEVVVGEDGMISIVDLATASVRVSRSIPAPATDVVFDAAGDVLVFSRAITGVPTQLLVVDVAGTVTTAGPLDGAGRLRATADGRGVFWTNLDPTTVDATARVVVGRTPLVTPAGPRACHELFPADDSRTLVTGCGTVLRVSGSDAAQDLSLAATLEGVTGVRHADTVVAKGIAAVIPATDATVSSAEPEDRLVRLYDATSFHFVGTVPLPILDDGNVNQAPPGRNVFLRADGARAYVLARRQSGQPPIDGIAMLDPTMPNGLPPVVKITEVFRGRGGLPDPVTPPRLGNTLAFRVDSADYSRSLNRLVMTTNNPTSALLLVDPATGTSEPLPTPTAPAGVTVRPDGHVAAVARAGGVTFVDLVTKTILREQDGPATRVVFGKMPEVLLATDATTWSWLNLDTGGLRAATTTTDPSPWFATQPGTNTFYSVEAHALLRHDDVSAPADPSFDLSPFASAETIIKPCAMPFWITDDGSRLVMNCSRVFALSTDRAHDLVYVGILETESTTAYAAYAPSTHRFFSAPTIYDLDGSFVTAFGRIAVHDDVLLNLLSLVDLGGFPGSTAQSYPQQIFMGPTAQQIVVLVRSDSFLPPTHAVYTFDVTGL